MNKTFLAASLFALMMGAAQAGEGNGDPFPNTAAHSLVANQVLSDTGSEAIPVYGPRVTMVTQGDVLPTNGSDGIVQTANSLPRGFEDGTVAYAQAQSMQRWALAHRTVPSTQLALRLSSQAR